MAFAIARLFFPPSQQRRKPVQGAASQHLRKHPFAFVGSARLPGATADFSFSEQRGKRSERAIILARAAAGIFLAQMISGTLPIRPGEILTVGS